MPDISAILAKPEDFGFTFLVETVKRDKMSSGSVPLIKVIDLEAFELSFPGVILETEDGQSIRVNSQRIVRDAWFNGDKNTDSLKTRLVRWLLKIESPTLQYADASGQMHATKEEAQKASLAWAEKQLQDA